jgi:hypothetical protein
MDCTVLWQMQLHPIPGMMKSAMTLFCLVNRGRLDRAIDKSVGCRDDCRCSRRYIDDAGTACVHRPSEECVRGPIHRAHIQVETEIEYVCIAIKIGSLMNEACKIAQNIGRPN